MDELQRKKIDESWKEQVEREKHTPGPGARPEKASKLPGAGEGTTPVAEGLEAQPPGQEEMPQARFDLFVQGLVLEAFIALGEAPHPVTRKQAQNLPQAKYLIDLIGVLEDKTRGNLDVDEEKLLKDALYQLRMRYLAKAGKGWCFGGHGPLLSSLY